MENETLLEEQMIEDINNNCSDIDPEEVEKTIEVETMDELEEMPLGIVDEEIEEVKKEV